MAFEQTVLPHNMGYVGSSNNDTTMAALTAATLASNKGYVPQTDSMFGGGGLLGSLVLASILGRKNGLLGGDDSGAGNILADIRKDVGDAATEACKVESRIQAAIQVQDTNNQVNFRALDNKICETEKSAIIFSKDSQIENLKTEARITDRITAFERNADEQFCSIKREIMGVNVNIEKVNTHLTHLIDKSTCDLKFQAERDKSELALQMERGFCRSREEVLKDELDELRRGKDFTNQSLLFSNQLNAINSAVADLSQAQKLTNQTIQFGTGNLAGQAATNNQVR